MRKTLNKTKEESENVIHNLWDEIAKAITATMPNQLFPLINEVFGVYYAPDTSVEILPTEHIVARPEMQNVPASIYTDIAIIIDHKDVYHLEWQMKNDKDMAIRMIKYDFNLGLSRSIIDESNNTFTIEFPRPVVIYPDPNSETPDELVCIIKLSDNQCIYYKVPTVKISNYSFELIKEKHLTIFVPYKLLSFRTRLKDAKNPVTKNELTAYVQNLILILYEELSIGNISEQQLNDYKNMINLAAEKIFANFPEHIKEVAEMTTPKIILPSQYDNAIATIEEQKAELAEHKVALAEQKATLEEKESEIASLRKLLFANGIDPDGAKQ